MDTVLTRRWLAGASFRSVVDAASVSVVRGDVRDAAARLGFDATAVGELALIVSELATNQLRHGKLGRVSLGEIERHGVRGLEILAYDRGEGIADPTTALAGVPRDSGSLGVGISSVVRFADEVDFDVRAGEGTCVRARKFVRHVGRRREVAVLGRPIDGEPRSGDDAWFGRRDGRLVLALADGLGHGNDAREAAAAAIDVVASTDAPPADLCRLAAAAAVGTRGTVLTVIELDEQDRTLRVSGGGNVMTHIVGPRGTRILSTQAAVLGNHHRVPTFTHEQLDLDAHDVVVMFTDGISARARLDVHNNALRGHPLRVAHHMLETFGRTSDDAMVVVST